MHMSFRLILLGLVGVLVAPAVSEADDVIARSTLAVRRSGPIRIDGHLTDAAWRDAPAAGDFWQRQPKEGAPTGQRTEFRIAYDDSSIYVGVRAFDTAPGEIRNLLHRRDQESGADSQGPNPAGLPQAPPEALP